MSGRKEEALGATGRAVTPLGRTLRAWRRYHQFSVTDLAERAGFGPTGRAYISKIEHGHIKKLGAARLRCIADALGMSSADLLAYRLPPRAESLLDKVLAPQAVETVLKATSPRRPDIRPPHHHDAIQLEPGERQLATALAEAALDLRSQEAGATPEFMVELVRKLEAHLTPRLAAAVHAAIDAAVQDAAWSRFGQASPEDSASLPSAAHRDDADHADQSPTDDEARQAVTWVGDFLKGLRAPHHERQVSEKVSPEHAEQLTHHLGPQVERHVLGRARDLLREGAPGTPSPPSAASPRQRSETASRNLRDAARAVIHFLHDAGDPPAAPQVTGHEATHHGPHTLFVVFQRETNIFDEAAELRGAWQKALHTALEHGWNISYLVLHQHDRARALALVDLVMDLLSAPGGRYEPAYIRHRDAASPSHDFILIPGKGALEIIASSGGWMTRPIQQTDSPEHYAQLLRTVRLLREDGIRLIHAFPRRGQFSTVIARTEGQPGDRDLVLAGLSELTVPTTIFEARAAGVTHQRHDKASEVKTLIQAHEEREQHFRAQVGPHHVRDLCPMSVIERYIESGVYSPDDALLALGAPPMSPDQRAQHLRALIRRLDLYPNYELGLLDDVTATEESLSHLAASSDQTFWMIKQGHVALLEILHPTPDGKVIEMDVAISEPTIVEAFHNYFVRHLWNQPAVIHDRDAVITWLRRQIARIRG